MAKLTKNLDVIINYIANTKGIDDATRRAKDFERSTRGTGIAVTNQTRILNQQTEVFTKNNKAYVALTTKFREGSGPVQTLTRNMERFSLINKNTGQTIEGLRIANGELGKSFQHLSTNAHKVDGIMTNIGKNFKQAALRAFLVVPAWQAARLALDTLTFGFKSTLQVMNELDSAVRKVSTVFDPLQRTVELNKKLSDSFTDLSIKTGISIEQIGNTAAGLARAGLDSEQTLKALDAAVKLRLTSGASEEGVTRALVLAYNLYGDEIRAAAKGQDEFAFTAAFFNEVANKNLDSVEGFINAFKTFAPIARTANVSLTELAATITTIQNAGFLDAQAGTILNRLFSREATNLAEFKKVISDLSGGSVQLTGKESPFQILKTFFEVAGKTDASKLRILEDFFKLVGEKGTKGIALIEDMPKLIKLMDDLAESTKDPVELINNFNERSKTIAESNINLFSEIGTLIGSIGQETFVLITGAKDFNSALLTVKDTFEKIRSIIKSINDDNKDGSLSQLVKSFAFGGGVGLLLEARRRQESINKRRLTQQATDSFILEKASSFNEGDLPTKEQLTQELEKQAKATNDLANAEKERFSALFSFKTEDEDKIVRLQEENRLLKENEGDIRKVTRLTEEYNAILKSLKVELKDETLSNDFLTDLIQKSPEDIGSFLRSKGFESDADGKFGKIFKQALEAFISLQREEFKLADEIKKRETELKEIQLDRLKALGFSEQELADLKLSLYDTLDNADEQRHKREKARLEAYNKRILEITEAIKSSFQSSFEGLFKNELTPLKFAQNIGDTFQNQSISSSARIATEAVLGTGIAAQFADAIDATEQNPIVRSFIEGARKAGAIIESSVIKGATQAQTGINTGDSFAKSGLLGSLLPNLNKKGVFANAPNLTGGGLLNAGVTGVLTGLSASQRGGTAGILGGGGGFLTSLAGGGLLKGATGFLGALAPALGPLGAALTIASFFSKSKKTESRTEESLISIAPKIDVSNKKLEIINRNLVALKNVMEQYVLPQSAYFSESRNVADQFAIYSRRGLA